MAAKKAPVIVIQSRAVEQELENLYARRSVLNTLIASLEDYDRSQSTRVLTIESRTA